MKLRDRREPEARALLRRIECDFAPHVVARIDTELTRALASTSDTDDVTIELPDGQGARLIVRGFPPTLRQRLARALK